MEWRLDCRGRTGTAIRSVSLQMRAMATGQYLELREATNCSQQPTLPSRKPLGVSPQGPGAIRMAQCSLSCGGPGTLGAGRCQSCPPGEFTGSCFQLSSGLSSSCGETMGRRATWKTSSCQDGLRCPLQPWGLRRQLRRRAACGWITSAKQVTRVRRSVRVFLVSGPVSSRKDRPGFGKVASGLRKASATVSRQRPSRVGENRGRQEATRQEQWRTFGVGLPFTEISRH